MCWSYATMVISSQRLCLQVNVEMEDNAIPEEYFTCHGDKLFDLLASSLLDFAKRHGRWRTRWLNFSCMQGSGVCITIPSCEMSAWSEGSQNLGRSWEKQQALQHGSFQNNHRVPCQRLCNLNMRLQSHKH